ncbi:hypothetical Protein YC6258_02235 [Gynuella sunshinyii YC6258]|uniref:Uncharacterized protein n=1 Tax=Gynuella sunshinyii YC6258 TaxID=1445510 RepID=A0A0C5VLS1_9GAMM|nr:hypothetical Protein YC6258_02235 [Gynuella sunshinyii YC6258]
MAKVRFGHLFFLPLPFFEPEDRAIIVIIYGIFPSKITINLALTLANSDTFLKHIFNPTYS